MVCPDAPTEQAPDPVKERPAKVQPGQGPVDHGPGQGAPTQGVAGRSVGRAARGPETGRWAARADWAVRVDSGAEVLGHAGGPGARMQRGAGVLERGRAGAVGRPLGIGVYPLVRGPPIPVRATAYDPD